MMGTSSGGAIREGRVGGLVHEVVEGRRIVEADAVEPAGALRVAADAGGIGDRRVVDLRDLAETGA